ncbi:MAG: type IV pilus assembly protein PilM [Spirochaetaceae bacterium]|nr:type IV pilus assembly protein PilM [Myxococcales bacterium]MCB9722923.1 type IV pilus assembly protein PilM [Spirochaetaceae bacterium]HPG27720.1 type IV pilus assembly protein PilM [Myxococcota bacterium]
MKFHLPGFGKASVIGLDIGSSSIKVVEIAQKSRDKGFDLRGLGRAALPPEAIVQGAFLNSSAIVDAIRDAIEDGRIKGKDVAASVSGHSVIVKRVSLPQMSREELEDQIQWEAEQYIPFDVNEVNLDFQILDANEDEGQMDVLLVAAKKDLIDDYVQVITEAGLNPVAIDVAGFAVQNAYELNYDPEPDAVTALVNIGGQVVNINVIRNGIPAFTRDIMTGGAQYTEEIQKALSVSFDEAERIKIGSSGDDQVQDVIPQEVDQAMRNVSEAVIGEISRSLDFFMATTTDARISKVLLSGGGSKISGLAAAFKERTGLETEAMNPLAHMLPSKGFDPQLLEDLGPQLAVGIGLASRRIDR